MARGSVQHNRIFSFSSRMSQQMARGTVEAEFSQRSTEIQFRPGLFPGQKRLVAVGGDRRFHVRTAKPATMTAFRKDFTIPIPNRDMARMKTARSETISNPCNPRSNSFAYEGRGVPPKRRTEALARRSRRWTQTKQIPLNMSKQRSQSFLLCCLRFLLLMNPLSALILVHLRATPDSVAFCRFGHLAALTMGSAQYASG
jgi:hypothetical protein